MFLGIAVDGSTSFVPGQSARTDEEEEETGEEEDQVTPLSIGSKRTMSSGHSTRSTGSSPNKKAKSPAIRTLDNNMKEFNII
jgi:hypothetical protein